MRAQNRHKKRATLGVPFTGTGRRILALSATAVSRILLPLRGASFLASDPDSCPLSLVILVSLLLPAVRAGVHPVHDPFPCHP